MATTKEYADILSKNTPYTYKIGADNAKDIAYAVQYKYIQNPMSQFSPVTKRGMAWQLYRDYNEGRNVKRNRTIADFWLKTAANYGEIHALNELGNLSVIKYSDMILSIFSSEEKPIDNNVLLVNVCYDKELAPVYDKYGFPMGNTAITDRGKLNSLLENFRRHNNYKYILMDVFLTPDFEKYPLFVDKQMSIAAAMYAQNQNKELCWNPIFAKENGRLIYKSIIPKFHIRPGDDYDSSGNKIIYQLGEDLLTLANDTTTFKNLIQDKWIVIGDFSESDIHQTYNGNIAGPLIIFNTFLNLLQGNHFVKLSVSFHIIVFP